MQAPRWRGDAGLTIVELIVTIVIIGILLGAATAAFNAQRAAAWDRSVRTDMTSWSNAADAAYRSVFAYPTGRDGFAQSSGAPMLSEGNSGVAFVVRSGAKAGYVLFGTNLRSGRVFAYSSWDPHAGIVRTELTHLPIAPPSEGFSLPEGLTAEDWSAPVHID